MGPCGGCEVLGYSTGGCRIPRCPLEACVLTWVHSEHLAAFLFYQAPLIATLVSLPVTFKMAQYMSLQNVHVTSRNLKDKRHTVAVLGADPDHLVLYSSLFVLLFCLKTSTRQIHSPFALYPSTHVLQRPLSLWLESSVEGETFVS